MLTTDKLVIMAYAAHCILFGDAPSWARLPPEQKANWEQLVRNELGDTIPVDCAPEMARMAEAIVHGYFEATRLAHGKTGTGGNP